MAEARPMQYRFLGRSGLQVSAISLGGWLTYGGHVEKDKSFACMKAAFEAGINFFDCAEVYSAGESERVIGEAIKEFGWKRNDLVISTKIYWGAAFGTVRANNVGLSRKHIVEGLNQSLSRLQLDYGMYRSRLSLPDPNGNAWRVDRVKVDIVFAHRPDRLTPMEETVRAFNHVIDAGKAFYWGTSEWTAEEISRAWAVADRLGLVGPLAEQPQYSMLVRDRVEAEYEPLYREHGLGTTVWSPLKNGVLTGKYNDGLPSGSRLASSNDPYIKSIREKAGDEAWQAEIEKVKKLKPIADKIGVDQAALALAWVLKNPNVSSAITGASSPEQLQSSLKAFDALPKLTDDILAEIDAILANKPKLATQRF